MTMINLEKLVDTFMKDVKDENGLVDKELFRTALLERFKTVASGTLLQLENAIREDKNAMSYGIWQLDRIFSIIQVHKLSIIHKQEEGIKINEND